MFMRCHTARMSLLGLKSNPYSRFKNLKKRFKKKNHKFMQKLSARDRQRNKNIFFWPILTSKDLNIGVDFNHYLKLSSNIKKNCLKLISKLSYHNTKGKIQFSRSRKSMTLKQNLTSLKQERLQKLQNKILKNELPNHVSPSSQVSFRVTTSSLKSTVLCQRLLI